MALTALVFDLDDTLMSIARLRRRCWQLAFRHHGMQFTADRVAATAAGLDGGGTLSLMREPSAGTEVRGRRIKETFGQIFESMLERDGLDAQDSWENLLTLCRLNELHLGLITRCSRGQLELIHRMTGVPLMAIFDVVVTSDDHACELAPVSAIRRLGCSPAEAALVTGNVHSAAAAREAGAAVIGIAGDERLRQRLADAGCREVFDSCRSMLARLPEAIYVASPLQMRLGWPQIESLMDACIETAAEALRLGQVPIAAVVARDDGTVVARGFNRQALDNDKTAHAEIVALRHAAASVGVDERNLVLASTVEPCVMCTGASMMCGVETVLFGLPAPLDGGTRRVQVPTSPESVHPRFIGNLQTDRIVSLFTTWLDRFPGARGADSARGLLAAHGR